MAPKRHEHLSHHPMGDTKASTCLQQNIKKCLLCLHEKLAIITYPSQNTLLNKKITNSFQMQARKQTSSLTLRPIHITHLIPLHLQKKNKQKQKQMNKNINDTTLLLKHRNYHFPPPTITSAATYVPPPSINHHILLHTLQLSIDIMFP